LPSSRYQGAEAGQLKSRSASPNNVPDFSWIRPPLFPSIQEALEAPGEVLDRILSDAIGRAVTLPLKHRRTNLWGVALPFPALPVLLMRRASTEAELKGRYWTLLGPWSRDLYRSVLSIPPENKLVYEVIVLARPFSVVHGGITKPDNNQIGGFPQVIVEWEDVIPLTPPRKIA
jgi:hypothetical protein